MARLRKSISVALLAPFVALLPVRSSEGMTMAAANMYLFTEVRTDCNLQIALGNPGVVTVNVTLRQLGTRFHSEQSAQEPALVEQAQAVLRDASRRSPTAPAALSLRREQDGAEATWDPANETDTLRAFRENLEKAANADFVVGSSYLLAGRQAKTPREAAMLYKAGLQTVGTQYRDRSVQDDTGLKLIAAQSLERAQGPEAGAPMLGRVLENRLGVWAKRDHLKTVTEGH